MNVHEQAARELEVELGSSRIHIAPGTNPNVTVEQVKAAVRRALQDHKNGDFEEVFNDDD
jgi:uncharacterized protein (DUF2267 family)